MGALASPAQIRAARGLVGWSQNDLAAHSGTARRTVASFEGGDERVSAPSISAMMEALQAAGVQFVGDDGTEGVRRERTGT